MSDPLGDEARTLLKIPLKGCWHPFVAHWSRWKDVDSIVKRSKSRHTGAMMLVAETIVQERRCLTCGRVGIRHVIKFDVST